MTAAEVLAQHRYYSSYSDGDRIGDGYRCTGCDWFGEQIDTGWAGHQLVALKAAGYEVVELPAPDMIGAFGQVWTSSGGRFNGPVGDVQFRPESGRIEIRDDYERDYAPDDVRTDAAVLLAAVAAAEVNR